MPHATSKCDTFPEFLLLHKEQLEASAIPEVFWKSLFHKLKSEARDHLYSMPSLLERMSALMEIEVGEKSMEDIVEDVLQTMWKFNLTYNIAGAPMATEDVCPVWYIMDEFGSRVQHSDSPTVLMVPFYYQPTQLSYTLMWPIVDLAEGDEVTRDYVTGVTDMLTRKLRLLPWKPTDMTHLSFDLQEPEESFFAVCD
ncbi:hypothetical protein LSH36_72g06019 [Paralvinella palmiformis]|uniref:Tubulin--tyrosine ligase-like protein 12 SET-like domain-containing protein n=1 Tax=Paralvinella palmiformis TaxID=53620 RepID=A0AAD9K2V2_9ANNE|nr:hypothetical protein LSH36_72g06019 [Paralvinella palmiformis]